MKNGLAVEGESTIEAIKEEVSEKSKNHDKIVMAVEGLILFTIGFVVVLVISAIVG